MGYSIQYGNETSKKYKMKKKRRLSRKHYFVFGIIFIMAAVLLIRPIRTEVAEFLLPGDSEVTGKAIADFTSQIAQGEPLGDAVTAFCMEILRNA